MFTKFSDRFMIYLATGLGVGNSPKAPGTFGSLVGLPFGYALAASSLDTNGRAVVMFLCVLFGLYVTYRAEKILGTHDDQRIVIDEIVGQIVAVGFFTPTIPILVAGFALFRLFDIWKPGPIGYIDERWPGAWGTFFDDILAGIVAAAVIAAYLQYGF